MKILLLALLALDLNILIEIVNWYAIKGRGSTY